MSSPNLIQNAVTRFRETSVDLLEYSKTNRDEGIFNDVTLQVGSLSIGANRMVLACCSTYFETMFKSKMKERYEPNILIAGVDGNIADILVDYMYNGQITIDNDCIMDILAGAEYFQLDEIKQFCLEYLMNRITLDNWYDVQTAATLYRSDQLLKQVNDFITNHFDEIVHTLNFKTFTKHDLTSFVSNLNRNHANESSIYQAIINWIKYDEEERKKEFSDLFQLIDLNRLAFDALQDILSETLIHESVTCAKSVMSLLSKLMTEIKMKHNESKIIMIGGEENSKKVIEIFNCNCVEPKKYPDLPYDIFAHCLLKLNDVVFCIGGRSPHNIEIYHQVYIMKLNDRNLKWSDVVPMNKKRCSFGAAVFCDHLVVAGGFNEEDRLASIEYFNSSSDEWKMGPPMQRKRSGFCLVKCNDNVFAFGGWDENDEHLSCVERLQSLNGQWEFVAPMLTKRAGMAGVGLNGYIYAIGGRSNEDESSGHKTVERYDPKSNEWSYVCEMNYARCFASASVLNERIFVAGGMDVVGELLENIECYDPYEDKWEMVQLSWKDGIRFGGALIVV